MTRPCRQSSEQPTIKAPMQSRHGRAVSGAPCSVGGMVGWLAAGKGRT